jgi:hypothetical protein
LAIHLSVLARLVKHSTDENQESNNAGQNQADHHGLSVLLAASFFEGNSGMVNLRAPIA